MDVTGSENVTVIATVSPAFLLPDAVVVTPVTVGASRSTTTVTGFVAAVSPALSVTRPRTMNVPVGAEEIMAVRDSLPTNAVLPLHVTPLSVLTWATALSIPNVSVAADNFKGTVREGRTGEATGFPFASTTSRLPGAGGSRSTLTVTAGVVSLLPAMSVTRARIEYVPLVNDAADSE